MKSSRLWGFQFTRPRGARRRRACGCAGIRCFNSRAREGRDRLGLSVARRPTSFNSRAREGRDEPLPPQLRGNLIVSIHAPARGATDDESGLVPVIEVSIHAPARGATVIERLSHLPALRFNSRAREGRDSPARNRSHSRSPFQFTRPRGARRARRQSHHPRRRFQFTRPRGARHVHELLALRDIRFQFTRPRGARLETLFYVLVARHVSIHAPARGATAGDLGLFGGEHVSIHAPARGATTAREPSSGTTARFNSRAREGRDSGRRSPTRPRARFNSRAREGRDSSSRSSRFGWTRFNSRAREGRDLSMYQSHLSVATVSIHAPARGATYVACGLSPGTWFQFTRPRGARRAP